MLQIEYATEQSITRAAAILRGGGLVAFPTETVYGLGANAADDQAVLAIFETKARPRFNPLIVHVRDIEHGESLAVFDAVALRLAQAFWPGPLTLVLPRRFAAPLSLLASAGLETVALRAPAHPLARELLAESRLAIAAPSANRSGAISATRAAHVAESLGGAVDLVLDGGPAPLGVESTIVGFEPDGPMLLRPGALARDVIEAVIGKLHAADREAIASPGRLRNHYAPRTPIRLQAFSVRDDEALLAFGPDAPANARITRNLSPSGDLSEAAANLFAMLHELDAAGCAGIAVMPVPEHGLGEAINDRLSRAAAPKDG
ncbi:MAG TPA: L-threonylcarbamoyladenylate synthase [Rhizomicrobium sp.]|jgi:L-threonylcarbamoyladenylate synthase|nr:L-threonylcarbamoyladenylate synthase [Rhizomicrobium sp.]